MTRPHRVDCGHGITNSMDGRTNYEPVMVHYPGVKADYGHVTINYLDVKMIYVRVKVHYAGVMSNCMVEQFLRGYVDYELQG